jgi:hypothetical protein
MGGGHITYLRHYNQYRQDGRISTTRDGIHAVKIDAALLAAISQRELFVEWVAEDTYFDTMDCRLAERQLLLMERVFIKPLELADSGCHYTKYSSSLDGVYMSSDEACSIRIPGVQWCEPLSPISAGMYPVAGMVTNRVSIGGCPWFYMDVCCISTGSNFGRTCAIGYMTDASKLAELFEATPVQYSRPLLDLILNKEFNEDVVGVIASRCQLTLAEDLPGDEGSD